MDKIESINAHIAELKNRIISMDYVLRGSISKKLMICGKKECSCHKNPPKLHGPYYHFTRKVKGKTVGRMYPKEEAHFLITYAKQYNKLMELVRSFCELSEKALPLLFKQKSKDQNND